MKRTKAHSSYFEPRYEEIRNRFKEVGFTTPYSPDLVIDLANAFSYDKMGESVRDCFVDINIHFEPLIKQAIEDENEFRVTKLRKEVKYHENIQEFLCTLDFSKFTGMTPLEKAANIVAFLSTQSGGTADAGSNTDEPALPIFQEGNEAKGDGKGVSEMLENQLNDIRNMIDGTVACEINPNGLPPEVIATQLNESQRRLLSHLSLLKDRGKIESKKQASKVKHQRMNEFGQVGRLSNMSQIGMPTFNIKLAQKALQVRDVEQAAKQILIFLIDISGSMSCYDKISWIKALMHNRLTAVKAGDAELFVVPFEMKAFLHKVTAVRTAEEAIRLGGLGWYPEIRGGDTDVEEAVRQVCNCIDRGNIGGHALNGVKPEIVVINDGQDDVDPSFCPKYKTHGFILGRDNDGMKGMIKNCGGLYERFL